MASRMYAKAFDVAFEADLDLLVDTIKAVLIDTADYTFDVAHDFLDDVPAGARATNGTVTLASPTSAYSAGVWTFDAADPTASSVSGGGDTFEAMIFYKDTGNEATSPLISYNELASAIIPNGGNITFTLNASGICTVTT